MNTYDVLSILLVITLGLSQLAESARAEGRQPASASPPPVNPSLTADSIRWNIPLRRIAAPQGWQVFPCDIPTSLCIQVQGRPLGSVDFTVYPIKGTDLAPLFAQAGDSDRAAQPIMRSLKTWVERHYDTIRADRQIGLGNTVQFETQVPRVIAFGHLQGLRYGFVTRVPARPQIFERTLGYVASDGNWLYLITTSAPDSDAGGSFRTDAALRQFEPYLDQIVANLQLPRP